MPERSPEIEQVLRDTVDAIARSDFDEVGRLTSRDDCVLAIGTDASEWSEGYDEIMQLFRDSTPEGEALTTSARFARAASTGPPATGTSSCKAGVSPSA